MNRQAIAFLTMFSLVLMLAVYYVTMPIENNIESPVVGITNSFDQMKEELNTKRQSLQDTYTAIIASGDSSSQEKAIAMEQMNHLQKVINDEKTYFDVLQNLGYENCYLEIENEIMKITVKKENLATNDASKIIKTILVQSNYEYIPEVIFSK